MTLVRVPILVPEDSFPKERLAFVAARNWQIKIQRLPPQQRKSKPWETTSNQEQTGLLDGGLKGWLMTLHSNLALKQYQATQGLVERKIY